MPLIHTEKRKFQLSRSWGQSLPDKKDLKRKGTAEYFDQTYQVDSSTPLIDDTWLYKWTAAPPELFVRHKVLFQQCSPADIVHKGWVVLKPAVKEASAIFGIHRLANKEAANDRSSAEFAVKAVEYDWLALNNHAERPCLMGIYRDEYVVAAAPLVQPRKPFVPFNMYRQLSSGETLKNARYKTSYRKFFAGFDVGHSFCDPLQKNSYKISYGVLVTAHNQGTLWTIIDIDGVRFPAPVCFSLTPDLSNLHEVLEQANTECEYFIQQMSMHAFVGYGTEQVIRYLRRLPDAAKMSKYVLDVLRENPLLDRMPTLLDILRLVSQVLHFKSDEEISTLIPLSQTLFHERRKLWR